MTVVPALAQTLLSILPVLAVPGDGRISFDADFEAVSLIRQLSRDADRLVAEFERHTGYEWPEDARIDIHLFEDMEGYDEALARDGVGERFKGEGWVTTGSNSAGYLVVRPRVTGNRIDGSHGDFEATRIEVLRMIATRVADGAGLEPLPYWIRRAQPIYLAEQVMTGGKHTRIKSSLPFATRRTRMSIRADEGEVRPMVELFTARDSDYWFDTQSHSVYAFLARRGRYRGVDLLEDFFRHMRDSDDPARDLDALEAWCRGHVGDLAQLDADWLASLAPASEWYQRYGVCSWDGKELACAPLATSSSAMALRAEPLSSENYDISCQFAMPAGEAIAEIFLVRRDDPRELAKLRLSGHGAFSLRCLKNGEWTGFKRTEWPGFTKPGEWRDLHITVRGRSVVATVDDQSRLECTIPGEIRVGQGRWGLGSYDSVVHYRRIKLTAKRAARTAPPQVLTWLESGPDSECVDILFVGDGYKKKHMGRSGKYWKDVRRCASQLLDEMPFSWYRSSLNVRALMLESKDAGCDQSRDEDVVDTALDCTFGGPDDRSIFFRNKVKLRELVHAAGGADIVFVMVNSERRSGTGTRLLGLKEPGVYGPAPTYSAVDTTSFVTAIHEIGHSFARLADAYVEQEKHAEFTLPDEGRDLRHANVTLAAHFDPTSHETLSRTLKWGHFLSLPRAEEYVWLHEGGYYRKTGVFRPWERCRMRVSEDPFCPVCCEAVAKTIVETCGGTWDDEAYHLEHPLDVHWPLD